MSRPHADDNDIALDDYAPSAHERSDGKVAFGGFGYPPFVDELVQRVDPSQNTPVGSRTLKQRLVGNIWFVCGFCCLGGVLFGFDIASMSAVLALESYNGYFGNPGAGLQGGISSSISAGSFGGSLFYMYTGDKLGRRGTVLLGCCVWTVGAIIQTASINVPMLVVGRVIAGFSVGLASSVVPVYQAEMAPPHLRGRLVALQQFGIDCGILIGYLIQYGCSFIEDGRSELNFRLSWGIQIVPAAILFLGMLFVLPESPRWLASHGRHLESLQVLANVHAHGDVLDPFVQAQYGEIREAIIVENELELGFKSIFKLKYLKRIFLGCRVQAWCQLSGINALMYYIVYIFQSAGLTGKNTNLIASLIQYVCFVCGTIPALFFMDRVGRRKAWISGGILQGTSLVIVGALQGAYGSAATVDSNKTTAWIVQGNLGVTIVIIFFSYCFIIFNAMLAGPISWTYPTEIYPLSIRSFGIGISTATTWAFTFAVTYFTPPALNTITWRTYIIFAVFCYVGAIDFYLFFPESANRTLEEMDALFESKVPAWRSKTLPSHLEEEIKARANAREDQMRQRVAAVNQKKQAGGKAEDVEFARRVDGRPVERE